MKQIIYPKFRWFVLITMLVVTVAEGVVLIAPSPLVGEIAKTMGVDLGSVTGGVMGAFTLFVAISAIVGGALVDKIGTVKIFFGSLILLIVGSILVPVLGKSMGILILLRVVQGCGAGPIMCVVTRVAAEWFPIKERAIVTGIQGMGVSLGIAIGFGAAPAIFTATLDWRIAMASMAAVSVVGLIMTIIMAFGPKPPAVDVTNTSSGASDFKLALKQPVTWLCIISFFLLSWIMQGYDDLTPGHIAVAPPAGLGMGVVIAGQMLMLLQIAFMIGSAISGFILDKFFKGNTKLLIMLSYLVTGLFCVSVMLPVVHSNKAVLALCLILAGFFMGIPNATVMGFIARYYPENITGKVGGMTAGLGIFGGTAGVAAGSIALHATSRYNVSIIIIGIVAVLGIINAVKILPPAAYQHIENRSIKA